MTGIPTSCHDNDRLGRTGCEATYSGNMGHCVAKAEWSEHDDGYCHATFSTQNVSDIHWVRGVHTNPALVVDRAGQARLHQDGRGVWREGPAEPGHNELEATQTGEVG